MFVDEVTAMKAKADYVQSFFEPLVKNSTINFLTSPNKKKVIIRIEFLLRDGRTKNVDSFEQSFKSKREAEKFKKQISGKADILLVECLYNFAQINNFEEILTKKG
jgi:hypothetical protein